MSKPRLRPEQAEALRQQVGRQLAYFARLRDRMKALGFPPDDPLYWATCNAYNAVYDLHVRAHYASCPSGVGRQDIAQSQRQAD